MADRRVPRLLVVTSVWPSPEHPSSGIFVANRLRGVSGVKVVADAGGGHWVIRLSRLMLNALRAGSRFDGVEAHILYRAGFAALVVARLRGLPLLAYAHGTDARQYFHWGRGYRFFVRQVVRHADLLVTNSPDTAANLRRIGREPRIIPPGYDDALFRPSPRPRARGRVLYLGGANPLKGYDLALRLAHTRAGPGIHELTPSEVARLMAEHDVVLMPTRAEAFGLVAAEAIGSGRWVVARDVGGLREIVIDGVNGTLVADDVGWDAALAAVPDYDPKVVAATVARYALSSWQERMAEAWQELLASHRAHRRGNSGDSAGNSGNS